MLICCFKSLWLQLFFLQNRDLFSVIFFGLKTQTVSPLNPCFRKVFFLHFYCNADTLKLCLRIRAPRLTLSLSQPAETVWKQQLQRSDLLGWVFQRGYSLVSYFSFARFQFLSHGNKVGFCWWFVGPNVSPFCVLLPKWYALWVSLWTIVFSLPAKNLLFIVFHWHCKYFRTYTCNLCQC